MALFEVEWALTVLGGAPMSELETLRVRPLRVALSKTTMNPANRKSFVKEFVQPELRRAGHPCSCWQIRRMTLVNVCALMPRKDDATGKAILRAST